MKIKMPKGFEPPKGTEPEQPFDVVASIEQCEDGSYELLAIDGAKMDDSKEEKDEADKGTDNSEEEATEAGPQMPGSAKGLKMPWGDQ